MAGTVIEVKVKKGDKIRSGQEVAIVESMKMEVPLLSHVDGVVSHVHKSSGEFVNDGEILIELA